MKKIDAVKILMEWDKKGKFVFTRDDFREIFPNHKAPSMEDSLKRLRTDGFLVRACNGIYVNPNASSKDGYIIEHIAKALRSEFYSYVSLESILSEYGVISQVPIDRITVMTTGRSTEIKTVYGVIEFTHTKREFSENGNEGILSVEGRPLPIATKQTAFRDLVRVGRNLNLINFKELNSKD